VNLRPAAGWKCRLISLNDSPELHRMTLASANFYFTGCDRAKGRFLATRCGPHGAK